VINTPGGMAGIIGAARLQALDDAGVPAEHFDLLQGTSAGSYNVVAYCAGQARIVPDAYLHLSQTPFFWWDPTKIGYLISLLRGDIEEGFRLNVHALQTCAPDALIGVSDLRGRFALHSARRATDLFGLLRASSAIWPLASGCEINGTWSFDGGFADPCPLTRVIRELADDETEIDVLMIANRPRPEHMHWSERYATWMYAQAFFMFHPHLRASAMRMDQKLYRAVRMLKKRLLKRVRLCGLFPSEEDSVLPVEWRPWVLREQGNVAYQKTRELFA
jgi:predicted patatin/cPLA2 family phospholipase